MNVHPKSISPLMADSPIPESPTSSDASSTLGGGGGLSSAGSSNNGSCVLFESYLYKIPPLKKSILMKWSKRWFTLKQLDASDPGSIELSYCKDVVKKDKRHVIDLSSIIGIRPTPKIGSADNIFAIETKERKYVLKAQDVHIKNIWLAKLCEFCGQEPVYHVTMPHLSSVSVYNEAIIKLSSSSHVAVVMPSSGETLLSIQFGDIRRLGYTDAYNSDVVWFETCNNSQADRFFFVIVPSGIEVAKQIVQELKMMIQAHTSSLLILEDSSNMDLSYIARQHYGCADYPQESRAHILHSGLYRVPSPASSCFFANSGGRRDSGGPTTPGGGGGGGGGGGSNQTDGGSSNGGGGLSLEEFGRRKSKTLKGPPPLTRRPTLDKFVRQGSTTSPFDRQASSISSSFDRQASTSSFDRSLLSTPSVGERDLTSPSLHEFDGHFSSGSAGDVFDSSSPVIPSHGGHVIQRKLSVQSSTSSQASSNSSISNSPATIQEEDITTTTGGGGGVETSSSSPPSGFGIPRQGRSFSCSAGISRPTVPPRSIVSLQQDAYPAGKMATAH